MLEKFKIMGYVNIVSIADKEPILKTKIHMLLLMPVFY